MGNQYVHYPRFHLVFRLFSFRPTILTRNNMHSPAALGSPEYLLDELHEQNTRLGSEGIASLDFVGKSCNHSRQISRDTSTARQWGREPKLVALDRLNVLRK
jgi:hypothetical protein